MSKDQEMFDFILLKMEEMRNKFDVVGHDCDGNELYPFDTVRPIFFWADEHPEDLPIFGVMPGKSGKWYLVGIEKNVEDVLVMPISKAEEYERGYIIYNNEDLSVETYEYQKCYKMLEKY